MSDEENKVEGQEEALPEAPAESQPEGDVAPESAPVKPEESAPAEEPKVEEPAAETPAN